MSLHTNTLASGRTSSGRAPRLRVRRAKRWRVSILAAAAAAMLAAAFAVATPANADQPGVTQISSDPYTQATAPTGEHATEVEPDTFAYGSTVVSAFQTGRVFNGGATDIGWSTSTNGGVSWTHGFMPATSKEAASPGPFFSVSDPSVAYDARDDTWIVSWLGAHFSGGGVVDVMASRSTDGGLTWSTPVTIAATGVFYDKNWSACDNHVDSPFYGHCYTEFDNASAGDLELMSTSADGGQTWGAPTPTADNVHGLGGQPVVQPNGHVVVPFEGFNGIRAFTSDDGGATWNASVLISTSTAHRVSGVRTSPLPTAEVNRTGTVYVAWQDNRFEPGGSANDIVLSTSEDGTNWSSVSRIPLDPADGSVDHFIPGLAVAPMSSGANTELALTYYYDTNPSCSGSSCQIQVGFSSSLDNGKTWSTPQTLSDPMQLDWLAPTTQGFMVGDYISTSFLAGQQRVVGAFPIGSAPAANGTLN
ncbi:MAG: sialidase family protein, partial [Streptosporangiaceae bacterium]